MSSSLPGISQRKNKLRILVRLATELRQKRSAGDMLLLTILPAASPSALSEKGEHRRASRVT